MSKQTVIIAIETSSRTGSVALGFGEQVVAETSFSGFMKHSSEIFPAMEALLNQHDLTPDKVNHIYISNGPGSFTGLRIAASLAKIMSLATSVKIVAVDSLDVVAFNTIDAVKEPGGRGGSSNVEISRVAAILDAKRGQFFIAEYDVVLSDSELSLNKITDDSIMSAGQFCEKVASDGNPIWLLGDGLLYYKKDFQNELINFLDEKYWSPRASCVYTIGLNKAKINQFTDPLKLKPNYLYRPEIRVKSR